MAESFAAEILSFLVFVEGFLNEMNNHLNLWALLLLEKYSLRCVLHISHFYTAPVLRLVVHYASELGSLMGSIQLVSSTKTMHLCVDFQIIQSLDIIFRHLAN